LGTTDPSALNSFPIKAFFLFVFSCFPFKRLPHQFVVEALGFNILKVDVALKDESFSSQRVGFDLKETF
jgi:hypothetical protein